MFYLTSNYSNFDLKSLDDTIEFLKLSFAPYKSSIRENFNFDWNTKRPHVSTVSKFEVLL